MAIRRLFSLRPSLLHRYLGHAEAHQMMRRGAEKISYTASRFLCASRRHLAEEKVTHTGQKWEDDDYRRIRFVGREKQVNEQFAIDLLSEEPVVCVKGTNTWCDGEKGALGHPKVYINLDKPEINTCGYCGKRFVAEKHKELFPKENYIE